MYVDTVTVFNQRNGTWYPTVVPNCDLNNDRARIISKYGDTCQDKAILHCRIDAAGNIAGKAYHDPKAWKALATPAEAITFESGNEFTFFWKGVWEGAATIADAEYTDGFYDYMNSTYDNVYAVTSAARFSVIPHVEVTAK